MYFRGQKELAAYELLENFLHVIGELLEAMSSQLH